MYICTYVRVHVCVCGNVQKNDQYFISLSIGGLEVLVFVRNATLGLFGVLCRDWAVERVQQIETLAASPD